MRGHRAYQHVCMEEVRQKATELPEHDVPPEIMRLVPLDDALDKMQMQKAATPVPRPSCVSAAQGYNNAGTTSRVFTWMMVTGGMVASPPQAAAKCSKDSAATPGKAESSEASEVTDREQDFILF